MKKINLMLVLVTVFANTACAQPAKATRQLAASKVDLMRMNRWQRKLKSIEKTD